MFAKKYFEIISNDFIECRICPNNCKIKNGRSGFCGTRENQTGKLFLKTYGKISGAAFDPIEKKPLYHFYPNREILSIGSVGCNLKCIFCQNSDISQEYNFDYLYSAPSEQLLELSQKNKNNIGIAFTYNEPLINFEFVLDTAKYFIEHNQKTVIVSNGLINDEPLRELLPYLSAANIDLKGDNDFYKKNCYAGSFDNVLSIIEKIYKSGKIVEVTNLVVSGLNDNIQSIKKIVDAVSEISADIPLHFSRYFPRYKYSAPATDIAILENAYD
ncbi:MAG TPA: AmmeMemoRadiSam system radical SAM enzyme, partial [bacterium]|nr:AmmeMemoRadiSam system radical SAM enzyme [bacterium]